MRPVPYDDFRRLVCISVLSGRLAVFPNRASRLFVADCFYPGEGHLALEHGWIPELPADMQQAWSGLKVANG